MMQIWDIQQGSDTSFGEMYEDYRHPPAEWNGTQRGDSAPGWETM